MKSFDVIVVGGGIIGSASALELAKRFGKSVLVIERDRPGAHASGNNNGNVRRIDRFLPQLPLSHRAHRCWYRLSDIIGIDGEFLPTGYLRVATTVEQMADLETYAREAKHWDLDLEMLSGNAVRARYPYLGQHVLGACLSPQDGHANPRLVAPHYAKAAKAAGASMLIGHEVVEIQHSYAGFRVTTSANESFTAPRLMNAAGAWAARWAEQFGEPTPLKPMSPQLSVTEPLPYRIEPVIGVAGGGFYMRQVKRGNIVWGGGPRVDMNLEERQGKIVPENSVQQWPRAIGLMPGLRGVQAIRTWSGIEGYMADMLPVLGPSATTEGLIHAFGFSGHGFQLGPGVGEVAAELIMHGRTSTPIDPFSITRFS